MMGYEDPCLFRDRRGGYHVLIHAYQFRYEGQLLYRDRRGRFHLILHAYVFRFEESCVVPDGWTGARKSSMFRTRGVDAQETFGRAIW